MNPTERNTFWACIGGWVLDGMDVQMFSFAIPAIIAEFAITNADAGLIGTATLLASASQPRYTRPPAPNVGSSWPSDANAGDAATAPVSSAAQASARTPGHENDFKFWTGQEAMP